MRSVHVYCQSNDGEYESGLYTTAEELIHWRGKFSLANIGGSLQRVLFQDVDTLSFARIPPRVQDRFLESGRWADLAVRGIKISRF